VSTIKKELNSGEENMRIKVVSFGDEIFTLNPDERPVHLVFSPLNKDILDWLKPARKLRQSSYLNLK
jgi:hypothetical protein